MSARMMPFLSTYTYLPSYLPTHLIIPSGPLEAISDLHTERRDGFTARLCTMPAITCDSPCCIVRLCSIFLLFREVWTKNSRLCPLYPRYTASPRFSLQPLEVFRQQIINRQWIRTERTSSSSSLHRSSIGWSWNEERNEEEEEEEEGFNYFRKPFKR